MYFIIYFLNFINYTNAYLRTNRICSKTLFASPSYDQPKWNLIGKSLKTKAREWFVNRAEMRGIKWGETSNFYKTNSNLLMQWKAKNTNISIEYPSYFIKPFHGYDEGNMNWDAAYEGEAATLSMSANYWKDVPPDLSVTWLRGNITENVDNYISKYQNINLFEFTPLKFTFSSDEYYFDDKILDIGCSFGICTELLQNHYKDSLVTGIDLSPYFLAIASFRNNISSSNITYIHANAEHIPFEDESYDKTFIQYMFHEMPKKAIENVIAETYRTLKPGGIITIVDLEPKNLNEHLSINIFRKWAFEVTEPHIFEYYKTNMTDILLNFGFRNIECKKNDPLNTIIIAQK